MVYVHYLEQCGLCISDNCCMWTIVGWQVMMEDFDSRLWWFGNIMYGNIMFPFYLHGNIYGIMYGNTIAACGQ